MVRKKSTSIVLEVIFEAISSNQSKCIILTYKSANVAYPIGPALVSVAKYINCFFLALGHT